MHKKTIYTLTSAEITDAIALYLSGRLEDVIQPKKDYQEGISINLPLNACNEAIKDYISDDGEISTVSFTKKDKEYQCIAIAEEVIEVETGSDIMQEIASSSIFDLEPEISIPLLGSEGIPQTKGDINSQMKTSLVIGEEEESVSHHV